MKWSNTLKPHTIENVAAQLIVGAVIGIGYIAYERLQWKRALEKFHGMQNWENPEE